MSDSTDSRPGGRDAALGRAAPSASTVTATGSRIPADRIEPPKPAQPSVGELAKQASEQMSTLIRSEVELAKTEVSTQAKRAGLSVALFVVAGALALYALTFGFIALAEGLNALGLTRWLSFLIVFVLLALVAGVLVLVGVKKIKRVGAPRRTIDSLKETAELTKHFKPSS